MLLNLVVVLSKDRKRILLGMKKRGFGQGRWNGFGGKLETGETMEGAAKRELSEEIGITPKCLDLKGIITFYEADPKPLEVHIFSCDDFEGEITETEEMSPRWFKIEEIPYENMWPDDKHWLPLLLSNKMFRGEFWFKDQDNTNIITSFNLKEVNSL